MSPACGARDPAGDARSGASGTPCGGSGCCLARDLPLMTATLAGRARAQRVVGLALAACQKAVRIVCERHFRRGERRRQLWADRLTRQFGVSFALLEAACAVRCLGVRRAPDAARRNRGNRLTIDPSPISRASDGRCGRRRCTPSPQRRPRGSAVRRRAPRRAPPATARRCRPTAHASRRAAIAPPAPRPSGRWGSRTA